MLKWHTLFDSLSWKELNKQFKKFHLHTSGETCKVNAEMLFRKFGEIDRHSFATHFRY